MLTGDSKFQEFIDLCKTIKACGDAIDRMTYGYNGNPEENNVPLRVALQIYLEDATMDELWSPWVLINVGNQLDAESRAFFINKITKPELALKVYAACDFLTDDEKATLQGIYQGNLNPVVAAPLGKNIINQNSIKSTNSSITKYIKAVNFGEGFITHDDSAIMQFEYQGYNLWKVTGQESDIDDWSARVNGEIIDV